LYVIVEIMGKMMTVFDVAKYILREHGDMTAMKLQKLCYYSQAWSLVWDERPIFTQRVEAWMNGPVCPELYQAHRGKYILGEASLVGDVEQLDDDAKDTIEAVLETYGDKSASWLSALTHKEDPWLNARNDLPEGERGSSEITHGAMADYYSNL